MATVGVKGLNDKHFADTHVYVDIVQSSALQSCLLLATQ